MSESIERVENLIRVVSAVRDDRFDICRWYDPRKLCGCAVGHAMQDAYFVARRFTPPHIRLSGFEDIGAYFDISADRAMMLFVRRVGYETRGDVLVALRVLLLEKMAQKIGDEIKPLSTPGDGSEGGGMFVCDQMEMA